jgi:hypothetical protein
MKINAFDDPRLQLAKCHLYVEQCHSCEDALFWLRTAQVLEAGEDGFDPLCRYDHLGRVWPTRSSVRTSVLARPSMPT